MVTAISTNVLRQKATQLVFVTETTAGTLTSAPSGSNIATKQSEYFPPCQGCTKS